MEDEASTSLDGKGLANMRVVDLKHELEKRGLSKSGSKKDLVKRLKQQLEIEKLYEERKSRDFDRKLELDAETQQNEFVQQYLAQQQKRYAERQEEKRLELEALRKRNEGSSVDSTENQDEVHENVVSDSDKTSGEKQTLNDKPSNKESENESQDDTSMPVVESMKEDQRYSSSSETEDEEQNSSSVSVIRVNVITEQKSSKGTDLGERETDKTVSSNLSDATASVEVARQNNSKGNDIIEIETHQIISQNLSDAISGVEPAEQKSSEDTDLGETRTHQTISQNLSDATADVEDAEKKISKGTDLCETESDQTISQNLCDATADVEDAEKKNSKGTDLHETESDQTISQNLTDATADVEVAEEKNSKSTDLGETDQTTSQDSTEAIADVEAPEQKNFKDTDVGKTDQTMSQNLTDAIVDVEAFDQNNFEGTNLGETDKTISHKLTEASANIDSPEQKNAKDTYVSETKTDSLEASKLSPSACKSKSEEKSPVTFERTLDNTETDSGGYDHTQKQNDFKVSKNLHSSPSEVENSEVFTDVSGVVKEDDEASSSAIYSSNIIKHTKCVEHQSNSSSIFEDVKNKISCHTSPERTSSSEHLPKQAFSDNMETSKCSSVPYSLSDIQLPESPGHHLKSKDVKAGRKNKSDSVSDETADQSVLDNKTQSNGETTHDNLNSSRDEVMSEPETKESSYSNDSPKKDCEKKESKEHRHSDESSDVESDRNSSSCKKKASKYEDSSSNLAVDSDADQTKSNLSKEPKSVKAQQHSEESDSEKSSDSEKYNRHLLDSKRKSHDKRRKRHSRHSRSSSSSSSRSSDSSPKRQHSKKSVVVSKSKDFTEKDKSNQMLDKSLDEKSEKHKKKDKVIESSPVPSTSSKKRLKIKRDNVTVEVTPTIEPVEKATSRKSVEKSTSSSLHSVSHKSSQKSSKQEPTEVKEIIPEVNYTCRKVTLSNRKLNRKTSVDISNEPKSKKNKWESFASGQKTSHTISISTDSLKNWFPDFKLISEASSSMELDADEHSLPAAVDEKNSELVHAETSNENDISMKQESTSHIDKEDSESQEPNFEDTSEQGPVSKIIFIQNLVRPFTLNQLKDLLKQSGKIVEEDFWIDKIKSKCFVTYETEKEAIKARNALNNTRWPSSNPKILSAEFSNVEELEQHKTGNEAPPSKPPEPPVAEQTEVIEARLTHPVEEYKRKDRERRRERERSKPQAPVREWDKDKIIQDSPERERVFKEEKPRSAEKKEKKESKKRPNEDTPAKLLDDLFQKTKNPPCIYWLPLTEEQAKQKEEAKKMRRLEREKKQKEQEEADRRSKRDRSNRRSREKENRKSSTRSRSPVPRRR